MVASSCSRVRTSRDRHSCSMRALDSSNSREARAMRAASRLSWARCNASAATCRCDRAVSQFGRELSRFEIEAAIGLDGALALGRRGFERRAERGNRVEHRVEIRALALDVLFGGLDVLLRAGVVVCRRRRERRRFVARGGRFRRRLAARFERQPFRLAALLQLLPFDLELVGALEQHFRLLRIERNLLLPAVDFELVGVHRLARLRRGLVRGGQLDPDAAKLVLDFGEPGRGRGLVRARLVQARARRLDGFRQACDSGGRTAPSPIAASRRAAACSGAPSRPAASRSRAADRSRR